MVKDILLDETGDLAIVNGDFVVGESDAQHMELIIQLAEGSIKKHPLQCVGIGQYNGSSGQGQTIRNKITVKAKEDGFQNIEVQLQQTPDGVFQYDVTANR